MNATSHASGVLAGIGASPAMDWLLDRTVLPGFSSIGYEARGLEKSSPDPLGRLAGRDVVVTGANSGIGAAAAEGFAALGATVHMVVRDLGRGEDARARIAAEAGSEDLHLHRCDLSSLASVRSLAGELSTELEAGGIAALVHNAGVMTRERSTSEDGYELTLATHVLGPLLLTELLEPLLERAAPSKVVFVTSGGMYSEKLDVDDLELRDREFNGTASYAHAKRIQVILAAILDARLSRRGVTVHAMHPGWVDTPGVVEALPRFHSTLERILRTPAQGADTILWLTASDEAAEHGGHLWMDRRIRPAHRLPWTHESETDRARMWARLRAMAQLPEDRPPKRPG